ncbi:hypothetical protein [Lactococcus lactis]|nr:hypothetical protein [Lactococcus lactis]
MKFGMRKPSKSFKDRTTAKYKRKINKIKKHLFLDMKKRHGLD